MRSDQPPRLAQWLLVHLGCGVNNEAVIGDVDERFGHAHSRLWYWRQVLIAIIVSVSNDIWTHKLLAMRGLIIGWVLLGILLGALMQYSLPVFNFLTGSLFEALRAILDMDMRSFVVAVGNSPLYVVEALMTLGGFITGAVTGSIVALLHRRKVSVVLPLAVAVLMFCIIQAITKHPPSVGASVSYFSMRVALTAGIVTAGVLWRSPQGPGRARQRHLEEE